MSWSDGVGPGEKGSNELWVGVSTGEDRAGAGGRRGGGEETGAGGVPRKNKNPTDICGESLT